MTSLGYGCAGEDCKNPVNWLLTHMSPPATISVCDDHYPVFAIGMLAAELGVDTGRLYDVIRKHVDREAKRLQAEAQAAEAIRHCPAVPEAVCWDDDQCNQLGHCLKFNDDGTIRDESPERVGP